MIEKLPIYNQRKISDFLHKTGAMFFFFCFPGGNSAVHWGERYRVMQSGGFSLHPASSDSFQLAILTWLLNTGASDDSAGSWRHESHAHSVGLSSLEYTVKSSRSDFTLAGRKGEFSSPSFFFFLNPCLMTKLSSSLAADLVSKETL